MSPQNEGCGPLTYLNCTSDMVLTCYCAVGSVLLMSIVDQGFVWAIDL